MSRAYHAFVQAPSAAEPRCAYAFKSLKSCEVPAEKHPTQESLDARKARDALRESKRAYHAPKGDPCAYTARDGAVCNLPKDAHLSRKARASKKERDGKREGRQADRKIVMVDGEGHDSPDGRHLYTLLSASDEFGNVVSEAYNPNGLTHDECAEMLLRIPRNTLKFWFMGGYDITKIVEEFPEADKYYLFRPELRSSRSCKECGEKWRTTARACPKCKSQQVQQFRVSHRYKSRGYDWFAGSFTVRANYERNKDKKGGKWKRSTHIWDCFRFFGKSFVEALKDWKVGDEATIARILAMKNKRGAFEKVDPEAIAKYCREECHLGAQMMRKVIDGHKAAGIELERYEGAGSSASALLKANNVKKYLGPSLDELPLTLSKAVMSAFFGGRFECSAIGTFPGEVHGEDISSAYPYAMVHLPCLACGKWRNYKHEDPKMIAKAMKHADLALAKFRVNPLPPKERRKMAWGPLPFRDNDGSICYPLNFEGWAWKPEIEAAMRGWPGLIVTNEVWLYSTSCDHKPFAFMPKVYLERCKLGKDGAGMSIKGAANASYGKLAQSKGDKPPFQNWVYAGMTTSTCRGQILDGIASAKDRWNVIAIATDGINSLEKLTMPRPVDTGTFDVVNEKGARTNKPLGGWEYKNAPSGAFFAKPGVYFALDAELKDIRARGVGRRELHKYKDRLVAGFAKWDRKNPDYKIRIWGRRFFGAKHCVMAYSHCSECDKSWMGAPEKLCPKCEQSGTSFRTMQQRYKHCKACLKKLKSGKVRSEILRDAMMYGYNVDLAASLCGNCAAPKYGTWGKVPTDIKFDPHPKRERALSLGGTYARLTLRDMGGKTSAQYKAGKTTPEGEASRIEEEFALEQPDWDAEDEA